MSIDVISEVDFEEELFLSKYQNRIESLFAYISDILWKGYDSTILLKNMSVWAFCIDAFNWEHMDYLLSSNWFSYEVFWEYEPGEIINKSNKKTLELILSWELMVAFINDYSKILLLNKTSWNEVSEIISVN